MKVGTCLVCTVLFSGAGEWADLAQVGGGEGPQDLGAAPYPAFLGADRLSSMLRALPNAEGPFSQAPTPFLQHPQARSRLAEGEGKSWGGGCGGSTCSADTAPGCCADAKVHKKLSARQRGRDGVMDSREAQAQLWGTRPEWGHTCRDRRQQSGSHTRRDTGP